MPPRRALRFFLGDRQTQPRDELRALCGLIEHMALPGGPGIRNDTHAHAGYRIPPNYDSMIGKLIAHAPDREQCIPRMKRALAEYKIAPTKTTIPPAHPPAQERQLPKQRHRHQLRRAFAGDVSTPRLPVIEKKELLVAAMRLVRYIVAV